MPHPPVTSVRVFGIGPFWAKMLFSDKKRLLLRDGILYVLKKLVYEECSESQTSQASRN